MSQGLDELITQLKALLLRQSRILKELEHTIVEEGQVIRQIEAEQDQLTPARSTSTPHATPTRGPVTSVFGRFAKGDHVYISNKVKQRKGHLPVSEVDRRATVSCIDSNNPNKVWIITDNDFYTWRLAHHFKRLQ